MAWNHTLAKELKKRDNPEVYAYFVGRVLSPKKVILPDGTVTYVGPIIISCFEGQVILKKDRLMQLEIAGTVDDTMEVALLGDPFSNTPGGQMILILGEIIEAREGEY